MGQSIKTKIINALEEIQEFSEENGVKDLVQEYINDFEQEKDDRPQFETNEDLVKDLMNYSRFGALSQMVVVQALRIGLKYMADGKEDACAQYDKVMNMTNEERQTAGVGVPIVNYHSWYACVDDCIKRYDEFYKR